MDHHINRRERGDVDGGGGLIEATGNIAVTVGAKANAAPAENSVRVGRLAAIPQWTAAPGFITNAPRGVAAWKKKSTV
jgi:hypothetical protein